MLIVEGGHELACSTQLCSPCELELQAIPEKQFGSERVQDEASKHSPPVTSTYFVFSGTATSAKCT